MLVTKKRCADCGSAGCGRRNFFLHIKRGLINIHTVNGAVIGGLVESTLATHAKAVTVGRAIWRARSG